MKFMCLNIAIADNFTPRQFIWKKKYLVATFKLN